MANHCGWEGKICVVFGFLLTLVFIGQVDGSSSLQYCSFFNNRAPTAQPNLKNCTWFKESSCCMQQEIKATFDKMKPLQGASLDCQRYVNYLMCYICAPNQNVFYKEERLTVCEDFCDELYDACKTAILKGSVISQLYANGKEFCHSRRFQVNNASCFTFDRTLDVRTSGADTNRSLAVVVVISFLCTLLNSLQIFPSHKSPARLKSRKLTREARSSSHLSKRWLLVVSASLFVSPAIGQDTPTAPLTEENIINWAQIMSNSIAGLAEDGLHYDEIQEKYNNAKYQQEAINGTAKIQLIRQKLARFFTKKKELVLELAEKVREIHDRWLQLVLHEDEPEILIGEQEEEEPRKGSSVHELPRQIFRDCDIPHHHDSAQYNRVFKSQIIANQSTVKIPDSVSRHNNTDLVQTIRWSAELDETFRSIRKRDGDIRWQYFGSTTGMHRTFPGHEWSINFVGFHLDYDPRTRPWYLGTVSAAKDVIIILDGSKSMNEGDSVSRMQEMGIHLLQTLSKQDFVNVIVSRSPIYTDTGAYLNHTADVLSCDNEHLVPASNSHINALAGAVEMVKGEGGSDHSEAFERAFSMFENRKDDHCQKYILFITDGNHYDADTYCGPGFYKYDQESRKQFMRGRACYFEWEDLYSKINRYQRKLHAKAHIFTFATKEENLGLAGTLACDNEGTMIKMFPGAIEDLYQLAQPYHASLTAGHTSEDTNVWTSSPYADSSGLGLMIALCVEVVSNVTGKSLGVVGLDVMLDRLEVLMRHDTWGNVYAFMVDRIDGSTIIHPRLKPSAKLLDDPLFVSIGSLETHNGMPKEFDAVLEAMEAAQTGDHLIRRNAFRAVATETAPKWRPVEYVHYFYTDVPDSDFSIAINLGKADENYRYAQEYTSDRDTSFLDDMEEYHRLQNTIAGAYDQLKPTRKDANYPGVLVSLEHSVVKLAPRTFCDPTAYLENQKPDFLDIHTYINTFGPMRDVPCPNAKYRTQARHDVKLTRSLEPLWLERSHTMQADIIWTYMATSSGVMRIYPGVHFARSYDPTRRPWYTRAASKPGLIAVSSVYQDPDVGKMIVTFARAVTKTQPSVAATETECATLSVEVESSDDTPDYDSDHGLLGYGCECRLHKECISQYCSPQLGHCSEVVVQGAVALDASYKSLHKQLMDAVQAQSTVAGRYCDQSACEEDGGDEDSKACSTRCVLVDDRAILVVDSAFLTISEQDAADFERVSLAKRHGYVFKQLLERGVFHKQILYDYQASCEEEGLAAHVQIKSEAWNPADKVNRTAAPGPFPPYPTHYSCIQEVTYYIDRLGQKGRLPDGEVIQGSLSEDPCSHGHFLFTPIPETNLYLLVLDSYENLTHAWNLNCYLLNKVQAPGAEEVSHGTCDAEFAPILYRRPRTCPATQTGPAHCDWNTAALWCRPSLLLVVVLNVVPYVTSRV